MVKIVEIENEFEWLKFRGTGVGASEAATLFGLNPYKSKLEYHHEKVGFKPMAFKPKLRMLYGHATEQLNSDLIEAWGGDKDTHASNIQKGITFRKCFKLPEKAFVVNDKYPHIFVSPDREIVDMAISKTQTGSLECKDTSSMVLNAYTDKIAPSHIFQLKTQIMVWEKEYGFLSYIIDAGRDYSEKLFYRDGIIFDDVKNGRKITEQDLADAVEEFWEGVVMARELNHKIMVAKQQFQFDKVEQYQSLLDQVEPEPDFGLAYEAYVKEIYYSFAKPKIERPGTVEDEIAAEKYLKTKEQMKAAEDIHQKERNNILNICKRGERIILGKNKYIEVANTKVGISIKVKN